MCRGAVHGQDAARLSPPRKTDLDKEIFGSVDFTSFTDLQYSYFSSECEIEANELENGKIWEDAWEAYHGKHMDAWGCGKVTALGRSCGSVFHSPVLRCNPPHRVITPLSVRVSAEDIDCQ